MIRRLILAAVPVALTLFAALWLTPTIFAELFIAMLPDEGGALPAPADPAAYAARAGTPLGTVAAGRWLVQKIAPGTWALGEPADAPDNYEYLIVGNTRALLFDAGSGERDMTPVLRTLTPLPITVLPSHLHFDHTNGLKHFGHIALIDLPETRARQQGNRVQLTRHQYLGNHPPQFRVSEWVRPDSTIDLGGRPITVLSTPGHTATSVSLSDPALRLLFTGDYLYPTSLYAFMADSSLSAYVATANRLLTTLPADTRIYGAHCCRNDGVAQAPWLAMTDLAQARDAIVRIEAGTQSGGRGWPVRRFPVNSRMTIVTLYPWGNR